ncbi:LysR family transcriptional regulator [Rhodobacter sp. 24-YEA-8]|uniref:LysR family transcriptional regulator n=1 Tax=Rhodobacter sp. 24-YEA-8 TaxID=1884310 RepID=UPI000899AE04|nr:LysR substrate-binding domain-containing protein [Rhodobacter sp. 24-YEA-8]SED63507.1 transcriptional regulator, LysR family [Rhodobacter sp. 24-YEA-8]
MDIRWLQDFLALAELRSFTRAAEFRSLSQAAFSRRMQSLEHWVGAELVRKGSQPVQLTEAGAQFREEARGTVDRLLEARASARASLFETRTQIRLAMPSVLARSDFRRVMEGLPLAKDLSFAVIVGTTAEVTARFIAGDADLLIAHDSPALPSHERMLQLDRLVLRRDRFRPYAAAGRGDFGFPGTRQQPFPLIGYGMRAYFGQLQEELLSRTGIRSSHRLVVQCDMSDILREAIAAGYGIGWLPESAVGGETGLVPVGGPEWELPMEICAFRPHRSPSALLGRVWAALAAEAG